VKLTTHFQLVPMSRICGAVPHTPTSHHNVHKDNYTLKYSILTLLRNNSSAQKTHQNNSFFPVVEWLLIIQDINLINGRGNFSETRFHGILFLKQGKQERQNRINAPSRKKGFNAFIDFNFILQLFIFTKLQFLFVLFVNTFYFVPLRNKKTSRSWFMHTNSITYMFVQITYNCARFSQENLIRSSRVSDN